MFLHLRPRLFAFGLFSVYFDTLIFLTGKMCFIREFSVCVIVCIRRRKKERGGRNNGEHLLLVQPYSIHRPGEEKLKSRQGPVERVATKPHPTCGATHTHSPAGPQINRKKKKEENDFPKHLQKHTQTPTNTRRQDTATAVAVFFFSFLFFFGRLFSSFSSSFGWK